MIVSEIITSVQGLLQDNEFPQAQIIEAANWFQDKVFNDVNTRIMQVSDILSGSAGDTTIDYPDDIKVVQSLIQTVPVPLDLKDRFIDYQQFLQSFPGWNTTQLPANINQYTNFGQSMRLSNPLLTDVTIPIDYIRNPVRMVRLSDTCEIPDKYREMISKGTLAYCMEQNEDYGEAENEWNALAPVITAFNRREAVGQIKTGPVIMKSNRRTINSGRR